MIYTFFCASQVTPVTKNWDFFLSFLVSEKPEKSGSNVLVCVKNPKTCLTIQIEATER